MDILKEIVDVFNEDSSLGWIVEEETALTAVQELIHYVQELEEKISNILEIAT